MPQGRNTLAIVRKFFPSVKAVDDADEAINIEVTGRDTKSARVRDHGECAMAVACKRQHKLDGVIISVGTAYLIKNNRAVRYKMTEHASREIVSFDRNGGFAAGEYRLKPPVADQRLGAQSGSGRHGNGTGKPIARKHFTSGIRTVLGSKEV